MCEQIPSQRKIAGILLPSVLPDLYWLQATLVSDEILLQDHLEFSRKSRVHRGKIRTPNGSQWVSIPVHPDDRHKPLVECRIDNTSDWLTPLWRALEYNYRNSIYFDFYELELKEIFKRTSGIEKFTDACTYLTSVWLGWLEVSTPLMSTASSGSTIDPGALIIRERNSLQYLPPIHGAIELNTPIPEYVQHFGTFHNDCCILDLIFAVGPESWRITDQMIMNAKKFLNLQFQS